MRMPKSSIVFAVFSALLLILSPGVDAKESATLTGEGRYFISSESGVIKKLFGARHDFAGGFTTDLTRGELWTLEKIFKISAEAIPAYTVSGEGEVALFHAKDSSKTEEQVPVIRRTTPFEPVGWGVKFIYGDEALKTTSGGKDVRVAILDTGVQKNHPDIERRIADCVDFTRSSVVSGTCEDKNGHGTHLAGIVAADGKTGLWGIASEVELAIYRVCNADGLCWADDVAAALNYSVEHKANIILVGFSGKEKTDLIESALEKVRVSNILVVAPVGNAPKGEETPIQFPAAYPEVVGVGAIDSSSGVPPWSARGTNDGDLVIEENEIEFVAPGVDIESTWPEKEYQTLSGTSQAAAFIAGFAAKLWDGSATSTRAALAGLAIDLAPTGDDRASGFGAPVLGH